MVRLEKKLEVIARPGLGRRRICWHNNGACGTPGIIGGRILSINRVSDTWLYKIAASYSASSSSAPPSTYSGSGMYTTHAVCSGLGSESDGDMCKGREEKEVASLLCGNNLSN